jgi:mannose-6-phosphate isomerase-like protein (cupin superfamily)
MAVILEGGCQVSEMRAGEPATKGTLRIWTRIGRATGAQAISLRVLEFAPGLSPTLSNGDCDEILYVLNAPDSGSIAKLFIDGNSYEVGSDTGVYLRPRATFALNNPGPNSVVLVSSRCPEPESELELINSSTIPQPDSKASGPSAIMRLADQAAQPTADRWYRVLVDEAAGSHATQFVGSIPPGRAPDHFHQYEEVLFILRGEGRMWAGEKHTPIAPGSCIYLPKGQVHCVENTGSNELRLLGVFYPAGSPSVRYET